MLTFFQTVCKLCTVDIFAVHANSKLQFVGAAVSKIHSHIVSAYIIFMATLKRRVHVQDRHDCIQCTCKRGMNVHLYHR